MASAWISARCSWESGNVFLAAAWYLLTTSVSKVHIRWWDGFYIFAISAIYRYVPSNVVHYIGRHAMLRQRGVEHAAAAWGTLAETALFVLACALVALVLGAPLLVERVLQLTQDNWLLLALVALLAMVFAGLAAWFVRRRFSIRESLAPFWRAKALYAATAAFALYIAARIVSGVALWYLSIEVLDRSAVSLPDMIAIGAAAWTLGYITVGASAGLGVREAVIIAALVSLSVPMSGATLLAIAFRLTTTLADVFFAALGLAAPYLIRPQSESDTKPRRPREGIEES